MVSLLIDTMKSAPRLKRQSETHMKRRAITSNKTTHINYISERDDNMNAFWFELHITEGDEYAFFVTRSSRASQMRLEMDYFYITEGNLSTERDGVSFIHIGNLHEHVEHAEIVDVYVNDDVFNHFEPRALTADIQDHHVKMADQILN
jgi:hypothetical protein